MRILGVILGFSMFATTYAYTEISTDTFIKEAEKSISQESLSLHTTMNAMLPARSNAQPGDVLRQQSATLNFSSAIFIIGDDPLSRQWLKENAQKLEKLNAIGFITNIESQEHLKSFQALINAPLLPANVDDLLEILKISHYPVVVEAGEVWQ